MQEIIKQILTGFAMEQMKLFNPWDGASQLDYCPRPTTSGNSPVGMLHPSGQIASSIPWLTSQYLYISHPLKEHLDLVMYHIIYTDFSWHLKKPYTGETSCSLG